MAHVCFQRGKRVRLIAILTVGLFMANAEAGGGWTLFWSDEFDSTALNESNWSLDPTNSPDNGEQEHYTSGHDQANSNIFVKNGCLSLVAKNNGGITSGRINTQNKRNFMHGRLEARMRLPISQGMWPAFWMLGSNFSSVGWPACGELDIMEGRGRLPNWTSGSYHFPGFDVFNQYTLPKGNVHDSFHIYAVEWTTDSIRWFCDSVNFGTLSKTSHPSLPFDKEFWFILNLAVGGNFDGNSDNTTIFPESLIVDYVRVYHWDPNVESTLPPTRQAVSPASLKNTGGSVFVVLPSCQTYYFELVSVKGEKVLSGNGNAPSFRINTGGLSAGVYCAIVSGAFGALKDRVVVPR
jgi:beta-glucanase (GH16 family)